MFFLRKKKIDNRIMLLCTLELVFRIMFCFRNRPLEYFWFLHRVIEEAIVTITENKFERI